VSYLFPSTTLTLEAALRDLGSKNAKARALAAQALGDVREPGDKRRAVDALIAALDDDRPEVRMEACASLGELGEPHAAPHLVKRLDDGAAPVRQNAAIALGSLGHPDGFEPLAAALRDGPPDLRFQAATSLAEIDATRAFAPVLAALADRDPQVVGAAALSVGAIGRDDAERRPQAIEALRGQLDHPDAATRFDVAYALAELDEPAGRSVLVDGLRDEARAWDAVTALAELGADEELARAVSHKQTPPEARVLAAGRLLGLLGGRDPRAPEIELARRVLIEALGARKGHLRGLAVDQLAEVGGAWARPHLEKLARSGKGSELAEQLGAALRAIEGRP
jgi:HEAT repeat protein